MLSWSLDTVGIIARSVEDSVRVLDSLAPERSVGADGVPSALRIGLPVELLEEPCDPEVRRVFMAAIDRACERGAQIERLSMSWARHALPANNLISWFESRAVHERMFMAHSKSYGQAIRRRLLMGAAIGAEDYCAALRVRHAFIQRAEHVFRRIDVLALPTLSVSPPPVGVEELEVAGQRVSVLDALGRFTRFASFTGQPALSLPCGLTGEGLPVGLQLIAPIGGDRRLIEAARELEAVIGWKAHCPAGV